MSLVYVSCVWKYYVSATIHIFLTPSYVKLGVLKRSMWEYLHPQNGQELQSSIQFIVLFSRCKKVMENTLNDMSVAIILWQKKKKTFKTKFFQYWRTIKNFQQTSQIHHRQTFEFLISHYMLALIMNLNKNINKISYQTTPINSCMPEYKDLTKCCKNLLENWLILSNLE